MQLLAQPSSWSAKLDRMVNNEYVIGVMGALVVAYLSRYMPALPDQLTPVLDNIVSRAVMLLVVTYILTRNYVTSVICTLVVLIGVYGSHLLMGNTKEEMRSVANNEGRLVEYADVTCDDDSCDEDEPLTSESVLKPNAEVSGYSNLWRNNGMVPADVSDGPVNATPEQSTTPPMPTMNIMTVKPTMAASSEDEEETDEVDAFNEEEMNIPNEINPDAIVGVMTTKQTNLAKL